MAIDPIGNGDRFVRVSEFNATIKPMANTIKELDQKMDAVVTFVDGWKAVAKYKRWIIVCAIGFGGLSVSAIAALTAILWHG